MVDIPNVIYQPGYKFLYAIDRAALEQNAFFKAGGSSGRRHAGFMVFFATLTPLTVAFNH